MKNLKNLLGVFVFVMVTVLIPKNVFAADEFDEILTDGKLVIPSVPQTTAIMAYDTMAAYFYEDLGDSEFGIEYNSCNDTFTTCTLRKGDATREVEVVWEYDEDIKKIVDKIAAQYPVDKTKYIVEDYEILNMHINGGSLVENSIEFKKNIQYKNFYIDARGGGAPEYSYSTIGMLKFKLDGTLYWKAPRDPQFIGYDLVYVSEDATDVRAALQARLEKLFPDHTFDVTVTDEKISDVIDNYLAEATDMYNSDTYIQQAYGSLEEFLAGKTEYDFLDGAEEYFYDIAVDEAFGFQVAVKKDSKKAVDKVDFVTNDVLTNVSISALGGAVLPLDTKIQVDKITSGDNYDKLISLLEVTNSETYDLKLYSKSLDDYITKLDNGSFQVKIPINDKLKGKDLVVYYVDSNNNIEEHKVTITDDGFAVFETDHFSVYTLAAKEEVEEETKEETKTETKEETKEDTTTKTTETKTTTKDTTTTKNPKTSDNILTYIITLMVSLVGITFIVLYLRRIKILKNS